MTSTYLDTLSIDTFPNILDVFNARVYIKGARGNVRLENFDQHLKSCSCASTARG